MIYLDQRPTRISLQLFTTIIVSGRPTLNIMDYSFHHHDELRKASLAVFERTMSPLRYCPSMNEAVL